MQIVAGAHALQMAIHGVININGNAQRVLHAEGGLVQSGQRNYRATEFAEIASHQARFLIGKQPA